MTDPDRATDPDSPPARPAPEPPVGADAPRPAPRVDPEDWAGTPGDDDERYQRDRPPHWE